MRPFTRLPARGSTGGTNNNPGDVPWTEVWTPGTIDQWVAYRFIDGQLQVEYELSTRAEVPAVTRVNVVVLGTIVKTIDVNMTWPAGRRLCGRVGPEMPMWTAWETVYRQRYGPLEMPLPNIPDHAAQVEWANERLVALRAAIVNRGPVDIDDSDDGITTWIGPFAMWEREDPGPGAPGGSGIYHSTGWQDNATYAALACEVEASYMSRMWAFYNANGSVFSVDQFNTWPAPGFAPYCNSEANIKPPPFDVPAPSDALWRPISLTHYTRVLRYVLAAYQMTGSRLAWRHLVSLAECARLQFSEKGEIAWSPANIAFNLATYEDLSANFGTDGFNYVQPGQETNAGANWHRGHGWALWAAACAKRAGMPWGPGWQNWSERFVAAMMANQMPNGLIGRYTSQNAAALTHDICAVMHEGIMGLGLLALSKQAGINITTKMDKHAKALYRNPALTPQVYHGQYGPWHWLHVGLHENGSTYPTITSGQSEPTDPGNPGDPLPVESYIAAMFALTLDPGYMTAAKSYGYQYATLAEKRVGMLATTNIMDRHWQAYLLAQCQKDQSLPA